VEIAPSITGILGFVLLFLLAFAGFPIALAFGVVGFLGLVYLAGMTPAMSTLTSTAWSYATSYSLMAVPVFILMGQFANHSGIGPDLYKAASRWMGRLPGGLAIATTWGCAAFAACTGSSTAGLLTFAPIAFKPMMDNNYSRRLALGTLCCGATMGTVIPPSITFIIYGTIVEESIGQLFMAGVFPGLLEAVLYTIVIIFFAGLGIWAGPPGAPSSWKEKFASLKGVWGMLSLFLLVIGGIYGGIFTPTEAGAIGAFGAFVILIGRQGFHWAPIRAGLTECLRTSCMVFTIIIGSMIFARFITLTGLSNLLVDSLAGWAVSPYLILATFLFVFLLLGSVMPALPVVVLTVPFLYPVFVETFGFSGIWFGVLICVMMEIAFITPPIGINLFALMGLMKEEAPPGELFRGVLPFVLADVVRVAILMAFPAISLWLPGMMLRE